MKENSDKEILINTYFLILSSEKKEIRCGFMIIANKMWIHTRGRGIDNDNYYATYAKPKQQINIKLNGTYVIGMTIINKSVELT